MKAPSKLTLRTYQVGFGDCFLLSFDYPSGERHVLVDFGSGGKSKKAPDDLMRRIAVDIQARTGGELAAVVATHRHKDHVSGFATNAKGDGPGDIIRACNPKLVLQPWTEDPDAEPDAMAPPEHVTKDQSLVRALRSMHGVAGAALAELRANGHFYGTRAVSEIEFLGEAGVSNKSAVENLMQMGKNRYLFYGERSGLEKLLPGVSVRVLGPPTPQQSASVTKQRSRDEDEFWHLQGLAAAGGSAAKRGRLFPDAPVYDDAPPEARWFQKRLRAIRGSQLLGLVRALDKAMNNTSLILLFKVGDTRLLFPGDAQIESWLYALTEARDKEAVRKELADVAVYKVGHHGSLNATPKSLWSLFERRSTKDGNGRLVTVNSTMAGKHGHGTQGTEVPRKKLVAALEEESDYFTTQELGWSKDFYKDFVFELGRKGNGNEA